MIEIEIEIVIVIDSHRAYMNISTIKTYTHVTFGHCTKIRTKKQIDLYIFSCGNQGWQQVAMERPLTFSKEMRWENSAVLDVQWIGIPKLPRGVSDDGSFWVRIWLKPSEWSCCFARSEKHYGFLFFFFL